MSDGMFDKGNEDYYRRSSDSRNILHYIVHFGDWMSTVAEITKLGPRQATKSI